MKKTKKLVTLMLTIALILTAIPVNYSKAATKYVIKPGSGSTNKVLFLKEKKSIGVGLYADGTKVKNSSCHFKWKSSNPKVVKIVKNSNYRVTLLPVKKGKAKITVTCKTAKLTFNISVRGTTFGFAGNTGTKKVLFAGSVFQPCIQGGGWTKYSKTEGNASKYITFSSSNPSVASIVQTPDWYLNYNHSYVKTHKPGKATITAKSKLGTAKVTIKVLPKLSIKAKYKKGTITVKNNSKKSIAVLKVATINHSDSGDECYYEPIKQKKVVIKPNKTGKLELKNSEYFSLAYSSILIRYYGQTYFVTLNRSGTINQNPKGGNPTYLGTPSF